MGTLANKTAAVAALMNAPSQPVLVTSCKISFVWDDATAADGPLMVGLAHSDYTITEIKEYMEAIGSVDFSDKIAAERSRRLIRLVGTMHAPESVRLPLRKIRLNWLINEDSNINQFIYNAGAALATGSEMLCMGQINLFLK